MCRRCGYCCTANSFDHDRVDITPSDIERWKSMRIWLKLKCYLRITSENETGFIILLDEQDCPFLDSDKLCKLHKKYGYYAKPTNCRKFNCFLEVKDAKLGRKQFGNYWK